MHNILFLCIYNNNNNKQHLYSATRVLGYRGAQYFSTPCIHI